MDYTQKRVHGEHTPGRVWSHHGILNTIKNRQDWKYLSNFRVVEPDTCLSRLFGHIQARHNICIWQLRRESGSCRKTYCRIGVPAPTWGADHPRNHVFSFWWFGVVPNPSHYSSNPSGFANCSLQESSSYVASSYNGLTMTANLNRTPGSRRLSTYSDVEATTAHLQLCDPDQLPTQHSGRL